MNCMVCGVGADNYVSVGGVGAAFCDAHMPNGGEYVPKIEVPDKAVA